MPCTLYIDESGDPANPIDENGNKKLRSSRIFCLGGIIADENQQRFLKNKHKYLLDTYFSEIELGEKFKLHYNPLRMYQSPYSDLGRHKVLKLENEIFSIIRESKVTLLSFTIELEQHYKAYANPVNPLAIGLIYLIERLDLYMTNNNITTVNIFYEKFTNSMQDEMFKQHNFLNTSTRFKTKLDLKKLCRYINNGDPIKEPILQFADFWTYLPYAREKSRLDEVDFSKQYYNYDVDYKMKRGNVIVRY